MKMRCLPVVGLILGLVASCCGDAWACELPAEPSAAALPTDGDPNVKVVMTGPDTFYYLVPEETTIDLKIVWDPYDHRGGKLGAKWDWCAKHGVAGAQGVLVPDPTTVKYDNNHSGPRFYDLSAMSAFFSGLTVQGDAVNDELGNIPSDQLMPAAGTKPSDMLKQAFVKGDNEAFARIQVDERAPGYPDESGMCSPDTSQIPVDDLDAQIPNDSWDDSQKHTAWDVVTTVSPQRRYRRDFLDLSPNMYLGAVKIDPEVPPLSDYKAFILEGGPNVWTDDDALPTGPANSTTGAPGPTVSTSFWVPTLGAVPQDEIKVKVYAPSAGFLLKNIAWAWEEKLVKQVASSSDTNGNGILDDFGAYPAPTETVSKCSLGLQVFVTKGGKGSGYTAYKVYDNRPPLASNFKLTSKPALTKGQKMGSFGFEFEVADTNPWADKTVSLNAGDVSIDQKTANVTNSVKIYYSYPVYEYIARTGVGPANVCSANAGTLDEESSGVATWKGVYYKPYWVWKEAVASAQVPVLTQKLEGGKLIGGVWKITGTANFNQPVPWHFSTPMDNYTDPDGGAHPSVNTTDPTKLIKVFALVKDSTGKSCVGYNQVVPLLNAAGQIDTTLQADVDAPAVFDPKNGNSSTFLETDYSEKPPMTAVVTGWAAAESGPPYRWQKFDYEDSLPDTIKPEIEVFIFDQRRNKYHTFGTKAGGWAKYTNLEYKFDKDYQALSPIPYSDEAALTAGMLFQTANDNLFGDFYTKNKSLVNADYSTQFICQQNTRLTFHVRAWDNINTFQADKGISSINYTLVDSAAPNTDPRPSGAWDPVSGVTPRPYWTFRTANTGGEECSFTVTATDRATSVNTATLRINFKITGEDLTVRSLEEHRCRTNVAP